MEARQNDMIDFGYEEQSLVGNRDLILIKRLKLGGF